MKAAGLAFAAVALLAAVPAYGEDAWHEYRSGEGHFAVTFPGVPKASRDRPDQHGAVSYEFVVDQGALAYVVSLTEYPKGTLAGKSATRLFDQARNDLIKNSTELLRVDKPITLDHHPGREVVIEDKDGYVQDLHIYLAGDRIYEVITGGPKGSENSADAKRFHASFRILAK